MAPFDKLDMVSYWYFLQ